MHYFGRMKAPITVVLAATLWVLPYTSLSQAYKNEKVLYLDDDGHPAKEKRATILHQIIQFNDTLWEHNFYHQHGHRISSFRSSDANGNVLNGRFVSYSYNGIIDTFGNYKSGKRDGQWSIYTLTGRLLGHLMYKEGDLLWSKDTLQMKRYMDSLRALPKIDTESSFPGGAAGWLRYLNKNLRYPDDAVNKRIEGQVIVGFVVDTVGRIAETSVWLSRSVEFDLDEEAIRIILNSPAWNPASRNGRLIDAYKRQPVIFKLQ